MVISGSYHGSSVRSRSRERLPVQLPLPTPTATIRTTLDQHPRPGGLPRRHLHPAPAGELPPRDTVPEHVRCALAPPQAWPDRRSPADPGPTQRQPDTPTQDRSIPATPARPPPTQDQLSDSKIIWQVTRCIWVSRGAPGLAARRCRRTFGRSTAASRPSPEIVQRPRGGGS